MEKDMKILYSGMQATGSLTLGNYLGALKNWVNLHEEYECFYGVMDLHSLTVRQDKTEFKKNAIILYALYIAAGLDPQKNCLYFQSHVSAHAELAWILNCFTYVGELSRMTQFKDKSSRSSENVNAGLFTYPVLMAADILLYQANVVPVGVDQKQHLEITRDIAVRFNNQFGDVFTVPDVFFGKGAKIMSLGDPEKKMSKSDENKNATIFLLDDRDTIIRKFKKAVTDSDACVRYDPENKPGIANLMGIYSCVTNKSNQEIEREFDGKGYGEFKLAVGEAVADELMPVQDRYNKLIADKAYLEECIRINDEKARHFSMRTLTKVKKRVGLTLP